MTLDSYLNATGLTEAQFAERISVHQTTVHRLRKGGQRPKTDELMRRIYDETKGAVRADDFYGLTA